MTPDDQHHGTSKLPPGLRRDVRHAAAAAVIGLVLFLGGFAFGAAFDLPSGLVIAGACVLTVVIVATIVWLLRVAGR
ncbi:MAG: hypothetical protein ACR2NA_04220 [Solirubrobacterales bacterium]